MATQVFISWSGELSKKLAEAVREWLPVTLQSVKPYFTPVDIEKGTRWVPDIATELSKSHVGIFCLTKESLSSPWIPFEAGALSKDLDRSRVCPLLFGLEPADVTGPLAIFQATRFTREEFKRLVGTINNAGDAKLEASVLEEAFDTRWPKLDDRVRKLLAEHQPAGTGEPRKERDILEEILELTRSHIQREQSQDQSLRERYTRTLEDLLTTVARNYKLCGDNMIHLPLGDESTKSFTMHAYAPSGEVPSLSFTGPPPAPSMFQDRPKGGQRYCRPGSRQSA